MLVHRKLYVTGRVHGVTYRSWAKEQARKLRLTGFVQNTEADVCLEVEGELRQVEQFILRCQRGPIFARVDHIKVKAGPVQGYTTFEVRL